MLKYHYGRRRGDAAAPTQYEFRFITGTGEIRFMFLTIGMIPGTKKSVASLLDITGRKRAEEALRESEEKYRLVVEHSQDAIYIHRSDRLLFTNNRASVLTGYTHDELMEIRLWDLVHPDDRDDLIKRAGKRFAGEEGTSGFTARLLTKDGILRSCEFFVDLVMYQGAPAILGIARDITERKRAEDLTRTTLQRLESLISNLYAGVMMVSEDGIVEHVNQAFCDLYGLPDPPESLSGLTSHEVIHKVLDAYASPAEALARVREIVIQGTPVKGYEIALRNDRTIMVDYIPIIDSDGQRRGRIWHHQDITERKQAAEALRRSEEKFRAIFDSTFQFTGMMTPDGILTEVNRTALDFAGAQLEDVINRPFWETPWWRGDAGRVQRLQEAIREAATGTFVRYEVELQGAGNSTLLADFSIKPVFDSHGNIRLLIPEARDITESRKAGELVRVLARMSDDAPASITIHDFEGNFLYANEETLRLHGYTREEFFAKNLHEIDLPESEHLIAERIRQIRKKGEVDFDAQHFRRDGSTIPLQVNVKIMEWGGREVMLSIATDISERKRAEGVLRESEIRFREQYQNNPLAIFTWQKREDDFVLIDCNRAAKALTGGRSNDFIGRTASDLYATRPEIVSEIRQCFSERTVISKELISEHFLPGRLIHTTATFAPPDLIMVHMEDITERKMAEEALKESEERYRMLITNSFDAVIVHQDGRIVLASDAAARIFGSASTAGLVGRSVLDFVSPEFQTKVTERIQQMLHSTEKTVPLIEEKFLRNDGTAIDVEVMATATQHKGRPAVMVVFRDITGRKKAEEALFTSRQMLQAVLDTIPQRVFWKDRNSVFLGGNKPLALDAGFSEPADIVGKTDYDHASSAMAERFRADDRQVMETGHAKINYEEPQVRADGSKAWLRTSKVPLRDKDGTIIGVLGTYEDITERKRAEETLKEREQLYRNVVEDQTEFISRFRPDGTHVFVNEAYCRYFGLKPDEVLGHRFRQRSLPKTRSA